MAEFLKGGGLRPGDDACQSGDGCHGLTGSELKNSLAIEAICPPAAS
jgi:hypothetical protein